MGVREGGLRFRKIVRGFYRLGPHARNFFSAEQFSPIKAISTEKPETLMNRGFLSFERQNNSNGAAEKRRCNSNRRGFLTVSEISGV